MACNNSKQFYTKEKVIEGTKYVAQFSGLSTALRIVDESYLDGTNNTSMVKLTGYILDNVIVDPPHLTVDDFSSLDELNSVIAFGKEVMHGKFREEKDKTAIKK